MTRLNYEFLVDFEFFLKTQKRCAHNTVMGYIKKVKKIVRQCVAMDFLDKDPFMAFKVTIKDVHRNILTQDELDRLRFKSVAIVRIDLIRDIFLFCCYTGLSFNWIALKLLRVVMVITGYIPQEQKHALHHEFLYCQLPSKFCISMQVIPIANKPTELYLY